MKEGKYFRIPQTPADLEQLWEAGERLEATNLPDWLEPGDERDYRYVGSAVWAIPAGRQQKDYAAEVEELEAAGLILDEKTGDRYICRIYMREPKRDAVWSIAIYRGDSPFNLAPAPDVKNPVLTPADVTDIPASFVADPFMLQANGTWHMFFEVMNWATNLGEIGLAVSDDGARWTYRQIVLAEPFHLSYPQVFRWQGDYYMIPETYQAGAVRLYKATDFPYRWSWVANLLEGPYLVDASVFRHDGRWWMFVDTSAGMKHDTLRLYHADALTGPWREHSGSPVRRDDPYGARPGGRVLVVNDRVFRYAQSCLPYYGTQVRAFAVEELTAKTYRERELPQSPILKGSGSGWNACGMHHVDAHLHRDGRWIACVDGWHSEEALAALRAGNGTPDERLNSLPSETVKR
jgi:hypothetical protein